MKKLSNIRYHNTEEEKQQRNDLYKCLRAAGFSQEAARRGRDFSDTKIQEAVKGIRAINGEKVNANSMPVL